MLTKLGSTFYNGEERPVYILQGTATQDGEWTPINGKDHGKVSVAALNHKDGSTTFVSVNGWRDIARDIASIRKRDSVLAIGVLKVREYNGKKYYDLDADYVSLSGVFSAGSNAPDIPASAAELPPADSEFAELPGDGVLPF